MSIIRLKPPRGSFLDISHPLSKGLIGYWIFNEGVGKKVYNLTRWKHAWHDGTITSVAASPWVAGPDGYNIYFNSAGPDWVDCGGSMISANPYTMIGYGQVILGNNYTFFSISQKSVAANYATIYHSATNLWRFDDRGAATAFCQANNTATGYYQMAGVCRANNNRSLFINGLSVNSTSTSTAWNTSRDKTTIGVLYRSNAATTNPSNGNFSYAMLYNRALLSSEILSIYNDPYQMLKKPEYDYLNFLNSLFDSNQEQKFKQSTNKGIMRGNLTGIIK